MTVGVAHVGGHVTLLFSIHDDGLPRRQGSRVQGCVLTQAFAFGLKPYRLRPDRFPKGPFPHREGAVSTRLHRGERERSFRHTLARG